MVQSEAVAVLVYQGGDLPRQGVHVYARGSHSKNRRDLYGDLSNSFPGGTMFVAPRILFPCPSGAACL